MVAVKFYRRLIAAVLLFWGVQLVSGQANVQSAVTTTVLRTTVTGDRGHRIVQLNSAVSAENGPVLVGQVIFSINGRELKAAQLVGARGAPGHKSGTATLNLALPGGVYTVGARYSGTNTWGPSAAGPEMITIPALGSAMLTLSSVDRSTYSYELTARDKLTQSGADLSWRDLADATSSTETRIESGAATSVVFDSDFRLASVPSTFELADLSGTGTVDLIVGNGSENSVSIYSRGADGAWQLLQTVEIGVNPSVIVTGDFNADGLCDFAVVSSSSNDVAVVLQSSSAPGTFIEQPLVDVGNMPLAMISGDFNKDGLPDLAIANFADNTLSILVNNPSSPGSFITGSTISTQNGPSALVSGSFFSTGQTDIAVTNYLDGTVSIFAGTPSDPSLFKAPTRVNFVGAGPTSIVASDLNGDGLLDLAVCNSLDGTISVLPALAQLPGQFPDQYLIDGFTQPSAISTLDTIVGGQPADLAVTDGSVGTLTILRNSGSAVFSTRTIPLIGSTLKGVRSVYDDQSDSFQLAVLDPSLERVSVLTRAWRLVGKTTINLPPNVTHRLQAKYTENSLASEGDVSSNVVTVSSEPLKEQLITFKTPSSVQYGSRPLQLRAYASSGLPVQLTVLFGNATIDQDDQLITTGAGTITIQALQPGNARFASAAVKRVVLVTQAVLAITPRPAIRPVGETNPIFTGSVLGLVGRDDIQVHYASAADPSTPAGTYNTAPLGIVAQVSQTYALRNYIAQTTIAALTICIPGSTDGEHKIEAENTRSQSPGSSPTRCPASVSNKPALPIHNPSHPSDPAWPVISWVPTPTQPTRVASSPWTPNPLPIVASSPTSTHEKHPSHPPQGTQAPSKSPRPVNTSPDPIRMPAIPIPILTPSPLLPVLGTLPSLEGVGLGIVSAVRAVVPSRRSEASTLLVLEDRRLPLLYGGVTITLTLQCSARDHRAETVLLAEDSAAIATLSVKTGEEFRVRVPLLSDEPFKLRAYFSGAKGCSQVSSNGVLITPIRRQFLPVLAQASPSEITLEPLPAEPYTTLGRAISAEPYTPATPDTPQPTQVTSPDTVSENPTASRKEGRSGKETSNVPEQDDKEP